MNGLAGVILSPLIVGLMAIAVRQACGMPVSFSMAFGYIRRAPVLIGAALLVTLLTYLGFLLLLIPLIWTLPWAVLVVGVVYRRMFGVPSAEAGY